MTEKGKREGPINILIWTNIKKAKKLSSLEADFLKKNVSPLMSYICGNERINNIKINKVWF